MFTPHGTFSPAQLLPFIFILPLIAFWIWMFRPMIDNADLPPSAKETWTFAFIIFLRQKTPPFRAGDAWRSGSPCGRLSAVPQGLREVTLVERGRYPSLHCSCQPVTAFHLRVSRSGPL